MKARTLLAVPLTSDQPPLLEQAHAARAGGADLIELRVDCIANPDAVLAFLSGPRPLPVIVTVRSVNEGGQWQGSEPDRLVLIQCLADCAPDYLDLEFQTWTALPARDKLRGPLIHSVHGWLQALWDSPAEIVKVATAADDARDEWRMLDWLRRHASQRKIAAMCFGPAGLATRVLAPKFGGHFTFGALTPDQASAPGQPTVHELRNCYRWQQIGPATRIFGVLGWPVSHSRSPAVHNAAMTHARIDGVYIPMPVRADEAALSELLEFLTARAELDVAGLSVTIPHKEHALRWLSARGMEVSERALRAGAVNTLIRMDGDTWAGDNTDVLGIQSALAAVGVSRGCTALVLGAGGMARAAVLGLTELGCRVTVCSRTARRAEALAGAMGCRWKPWTDRAAVDADLVVNATSVGMQPESNASPLPASALHPGTTVVDAVYTPPMTQLLRNAQRAGCRIVPGTEVFLAQAAAQFQCWHGCSAPLDVMRTALEA